jgi:parallel beta-helix repeat protein
MATPSPLFPPTTGPFALRKEVPASFLIWFDGTNYHGDSMGGASDAPISTDCGAVTQYCLNNLTAGRTWREKIILRGSPLTFTTNALIPGYTTLEIQGKVTESNGANLDAIFKNQHYATNTLDPFIDIIGGEIDGNGSQQISGNGMAIDFFGQVSFSSLIGTYIHNTRGITLDWRSAAGATPLGNTIALNRFLGPQTGPVGDLVGGDTITESLFFKNRFESSNQNGFTQLTPANNVYAFNIYRSNAGHGYEIQGGNYNTYLANIYHDNSLSGFHIVPYDVIGAIPLGFTIDNERFFANGQHGLAIQTGATLGSTKAFTVSNCKAYNNAYCGFQLGSLVNSTIRGNQAYNNNFGNTQTTDDKATGIFIQASASRPSNNLVIDGNLAWDDQGSPTQKWGISLYPLNPVTNSKVSNNQAFNNVTAQWEYPYTSGNESAHNLGLDIIGFATVATYSNTLLTAAVPNAINYTPPLAAGMYQVIGIVNVTGWTTPASFTLVLAYKDASGNARNPNLNCVRSGGGESTAINAVDQWYSQPYFFQIDNSATPITVSTAGTFTGSPVYNLGVILQRYL